MHKTMHNIISCIRNIEKRQILWRKKSDQWLLGAGMGIGLPANEGTRALLEVMEMF